MIRKDWKVRDISDQAVNNIKLAAKERGLSIGEFLSAEFGAYEKSGVKGARKWTINKISEAAIEDIKEGAAMQNLSVGTYLGRIAKKQVGHSKCRSTLEKIRELVEVSL